MLYFSLNFPFSDLLCNFCWKKNSKLTKLYEEAEEKIEEELNIVKIANSLRDLRILMEKSLLSKEIEYEIAHAEINIINLDKTEEESEISIDGLR